MSEKVSKVDYSKGLIYKLCCKEPVIEDIYIGSTTNFKIRKNQHKTSCCNVNSNKYNMKIYKFIRDNGGFNNWDMIMIEEYSCNNKKQLETRERYWIEQLKSNLNSELPTQTMSEWYSKNKERISIEGKEHRKNNKEQISKQRKEYREKQKEKINEQQKEYRKQNINKIRIQDKKSYEKNKKEIEERNKKPIECEFCKCIVRKDFLKRHQKSKKCMKFRECLIE